MGTSSKMGYGAWEVLICVVALVIEGFGLPQLLPEPSSLQLPCDKWPTATTGMTCSSSTRRSRGSGGRNWCILSRKRPCQCPAHQTHEPTSRKLDTATASFGLQQTQTLLLQLAQILFGVFKS